MDQQLKCTTHNDEDIILIDISKQCYSKNRLYCIECLKKVQLENTCSIKKVPNLFSQYSQKVIEDINEQIEEQKKKIYKTIKLIDTLKQQTLKIYNDILLKFKQEEEQLNQIQTNQKQNYENLIVEMTRSKLEQIAQLLSGKDQEQTQLPNYNTISIEIVTNFKSLVQDQSNTIKQIIQELQKYCNITNPDILLDKVKNEFINENDEVIKKYNNVIRTLIKANKRSNSCYYDNIQKCEQELNKYIIKKQQEQTFQVTGVKNKVNQDQVNQLEQNKDSYILLGGEIAVNFNQLIIDQQECIAEIKRMLIDQMILQSQLKQQQVCYALACNQNQNMIVGGRENDIVIWQQNQFELKEISVLKGHTDHVYAIVIYQLGNMIVTGSKDKSIKLWRKQDNKWNCIQTINDHKERITDLQLSKNQEQIVSASEDKLIKIWKMKQPNCQLECIQTIDDHNNWVYWITISQDSMFMASSSFQNYFNIYLNEQTEINPWKKFNKIETKGQIHRVYFTNNDELLVQQVDPPLLIVYLWNQYNQYLAIQYINLNQPDNTNILIPIFEMNNKIYLKHEKFVYIIKRSKTGKYFIQQILAQLCASGCRDCTGEGIILRNNDLSIDIYK